MQQSNLKAAVTIGTDFEVYLIQSVFQYKNPSIACLRESHLTHT